MVELKLSQVIADPECQPRVELDEGVAEEYAEALLAGCSFPPVVVFHDGRTYWLSSGFHRLRAHELAGRKTILCDAREGDKRAAILFSVGTNVNHGLRRSNADKRRSALTLLADAEWGRWSSREIARRCGVSPNLVALLRDELSAHKGQIEARRGGTTYTMSFREQSPEQLAEAVQAETERHRPGWHREATAGLETAERALACLGESHAAVFTHTQAALAELRRLDKGRVA